MTKQKKTKEVYSRAYTISKRIEQLTTEFNGLSDYEKLEIGLQYSGNINIGEQELIDAYSTAVNFILGLVQRAFSELATEKKTTVAEDRKRDYVSALATLQTETIEYEKTLPATYASIIQANIIAALISKELFPRLSDFVSEDDLAKKLEEANGNK